MQQVKALWVSPMKLWNAFQNSSKDWKNKLKTAGIVRFTLALAIFVGPLFLVTWAEFVVTVTFGQAASALFDVSWLTTVTSTIGNIATVFAVLILLGFVVIAFQAWVPGGILLTVGLVLSNVFWEDPKRIFVKSLHVLLPSPLISDYLDFVDDAFGYLSAAVTGLTLILTVPGLFVTLKATRIRLRKGEAAYLNGRFGKWLRKDSYNIGAILLRNIGTILLRVITFGALSNRSDSALGELQWQQAGPHTEAQKPRQSAAKKKIARKQSKQARRNNRKR
ncbi:hypothetical protein [Microbacterium sp. A93]|uniref:hypothetical protein n=1 Tax=Microbacterium sp. A93 TaxID=3450716 RepID=UPI003F41F514